MIYLQILKSDLEKQKLHLEELQKDGGSKREVEKFKREITSLEASIKRQEERIEREKEINELEQRLPESITKSFDYRFNVEGYINRNMTPFIGSVTYEKDGRLVFRYGTDSEKYDGKEVMQEKDGHIYHYKESRTYSNVGVQGKTEELKSVFVEVKKTNLRNNVQERFGLNSENRFGKWSYNLNNTYDSNDIENASKIPFDELLTKYATSSELKSFFYSNYDPVIEEEKQLINEEQDQEVTIPDGGLTVDELKKEYEYVFVNSDIVTARKVENGVKDYVFFKDKNGLLMEIPELSCFQEGDINGTHYKRSDAMSYSTGRTGIKAYDVHEWGFDVQPGEDLSKINRYSSPYRYDKYTRYVTINGSQKLLKICESNEDISSPVTPLYHRYKDENGKQNIKLVDLHGNIHSIKENGKAGEKGLKEKTFGPRGDYQLKVVYKDKEPVYAIFMGEYMGGNRDFCTSEELRNCYIEYKTRFERSFGEFGTEGSCFEQMQEVIERFNESFMQGNFVPAISKTQEDIEKIEISDLAKELSELGEKEKKAKELFEDYRTRQQTVNRTEF